MVRNLVESLMKGSPVVPDQLRFVATTYNLWATHRWPERVEPLRGYFELAAPDIVCLQELREESRSLLDETLPEHSRVDDPYEGWLLEGNIYWANALFSLLDYGAVDIGQQSPRRRLFWVRLQPTNSDRTLIVSNVHFTYQGQERERTEGISPRLDETRRTLAALDSIAHEDEPVLFMGDLNDSVNAIRLLRDAGYVDSFTASGAPLQSTHPSPPTAMGTPLVLDWQFHRGPIRAMNSHVGHFFVGDVAPSDHKPVVATYGMER